MADEKEGLSKNATTILEPLLYELKFDSLPPHVLLERDTDGKFKYTNELDMVLDAEREGIFNSGLDANEFTPKQKLALAYALLNTRAKYGMQYFGETVNDLRDLLSNAHKHENLHTAVTKFMEGALLEEYGKDSFIAILEVVFELEPGIRMKFPSIPRTVLGRAFNNELGETAQTIAIETIRTTTDGKTRYTEYTSSNSVRAFIINCMLGRYGETAAEKGREFVEQHAPENPEIVQTIMWTYLRHLEYPNSKCKKEQEIIESYIKRIFAGTFGDSDETRKSGIEAAISLLYSDLVRFQLHADPRPESFKLLIDILANTHGEIVKEVAERLGKQTRMHAVEKKYGSFDERLAKSKKENEQKRIGELLLTNENELQIQGLKDLLVNSDEEFVTRTMEEIVAKSESCLCLFLASAEREMTSKSGISKRTIGYLEILETHADEETLAKLADDVVAPKLHDWLKRNVQTASKSGFKESPDTMERTRDFVRACLRKNQGNGVVPGVREVVARVRRS